MASEAVRNAVEKLRQALIDDGMDEVTAEAITHAAMPNEQVMAGNIADLMRSGEGGGTPLAEAAATGSYDDWTKAELQTELDDQGIDWATSDTKAELVAKLEGGG